MFTPCYKIIFVTYLFHAAFGTCACISSLLHGRKPCLIVVMCGTWWWNCWTAKQISGQEWSDLACFVRALHIASSSLQSAAWRMTCNMACPPPTCIHTLSPRRKSDVDQYHPVMFQKVNESVFFFIENTFTLSNLSPAGVVFSSVGVVLSPTWVALSLEAVVLPSGAVYSGVWSGSSSNRSGGRLDAS